MPIIQSNLPKPSASPGSFIEEKVLNTTSLGGTGQNIDMEKSLLIIVAKEKNVIQDNSMCHAVTLLSISQAGIKLSLMMACL